MSFKFLFLITVFFNSALGRSIEIAGKSEYRNYPRDEIVPMKQNDKFLQFANEVRCFFFDFLIVSFSIALSICVS
jgi:hypothetical protein